MKYRLYGVVVHLGGSTANGHYTAYVRVGASSDSSRITCPDDFFQKKLLDRRSFRSPEFIIQHVEEQESSSVDGQMQTDSDFPDSNIAGKWFHVNDSWVTEVDFKEVREQEAYLLFYERIIPGSSAV